MTDLAEFFTVSPTKGMNADNPGLVQNLLSGKWQDASTFRNDIIDPLNGEPFLRVPDTQDIQPFIENLRNTPKSGLHNPLKNPARYRVFGRICARAAALLAEPEIEHFMTSLLQRVMPKTWVQCLGEVVVTRVFLENFAGDGVRFLARGFSNPGDHDGQETRGYRWPYGPVVVIAPFNFPLEIPALQVLGALFMGNRPLVKVDSKVSVVFEQFLRLLIHCGLDPEDIDLIHCRGEAMGGLIKQSRDDIRLVQFTGSTQIAELISATVGGKVRLEDAGFDWKIIGPDFDEQWVESVAAQSDQDAYNATGQKCSAQSIVFIHDNWVPALLPLLGELAARRSLDDLSIGPILSVTNQQIESRIESVLSIPGTELLFGGNSLENHSIPACYGAFQPTAISVPLEQFSSEHFDLLTRELFGPFQLIVTYGDHDISALLSVVERLSHHLTAAVVSADPEFQNQVLSATVNGTTYCGMRARTTGAPQNHWFGPCGDPRAAGIGTSEAIIHTWSGHREVIFDQLLPR